MTDMDRAAQVEVLDDGGDVGGIVIHVVPVADLTRAPVSAPVMGDDAKTLTEEVQHLSVPVVCAERPAVMKHQRLCVLRTPVFEVDLCAIFACYRTHGCLLLFKQS